MDFAIAFVVLLGMMAFYGVAPTGGRPDRCPLFLLLALVTALGVGLWLSALNVRYRDVSYADPVPGADLDVRDAGGVLQQPRPGALALALSASTR